MTVSEAKRHRTSIDPAVRAEAERVLSARAARASRVRPKRAAGVKAKAEKKATRAEARRVVYAAVDARSCGRCEACFIGAGMLTQGASHDHFWGRAREESVESVWLLCRGCDHEKTNNEPNRIAWLAKFQRHAAAHGYCEQAAKCDRAIGLERAQHPPVRTA